ncbi:MAG TPA: hypothetical protein VN832_14780 [Stellaceae bacterium]|nr:hypothetical protein [Stellaceae bacterium]
MASDVSTTIVSASDAGYFDLLQGLVRSLRAGAGDRRFALSILDLGLAEEQRRWLADSGAALERPGWDLDFPGRALLPEHYKAMAARPYLPRHFPGYDVYLWIDADAWVQDRAVLDIFIRAAWRGQLAIVPEIDRGYWTIHKRPKRWGQNQKAFAWAYGLGAGYRFGRNAILNVGAFALKRDAPHWRLWAEAHARALRRPRLFRKPDLGNQSFFLSEQTALNHVVYAEGAPATFLPAYCNWFCGKGTPMYDDERHLLVEPHEPHHPLGIVHLAGAGMKERLWRLATLAGGSVETKLTYEAVQALAAPFP